MTSNDETELEAIIKGFKKKLSDPDNFKAQLMNLKHALAVERRHYIGSTLPEKAAIETVGKLLKVLSEAEGYFQILRFEELDYSQPTKDKMPEVVRQAISKRSQMLRSLTARNTLLEDSETTLRSFPRIIGILKNAVLEEAYALVHGQQTKDKIQTINVAIMAHYCHEAGIEVSDSVGSKFHNLTKWLLRQSDPQKAIRKAKELHEQFLQAGSKTV